MFIQTAVEDACTQSTLSNSEHATGACDLYIGQVTIFPRAVGTGKKLVTIDSMSVRGRIHFRELTRE